MNAHQVDQETAERLLGGSAVDPQDGHEALVRLLLVIRTSPQPNELAGEGAAMQAFRVARLGLGPASPGHSTRQSFSARLRTLKVALAAVAVAATGGVALAAANGALPHPLRGDVPGAVSSAVDRPPPTEVGADASPSTAPDNDADPPGSLVGLCRAYQADPGDNAGGALESPAFTALIRTAGGRKNVAAYCDRLLAPKKDPAFPTGAPTDRPGSEPTEPPGGRTDTRPDQPTGRPPVPATHPAPAPTGGTPR